MYVSGDKEGLEGDKFLFYTSTCCSSRVKYRFWREKEASPWDRETTTSTLDIPRGHWEGYVVQRDLGSDRAITPGSGTIAGSIQPSQEYQDHTLLENHFFEDPEKFDSWPGVRWWARWRGGRRCWRTSGT